MAARVLADPGPGARPVRGGAAPGGRHHAVRAPGGRPLGHPDRADRRRAGEAQKNGNGAKPAAELEELPSGEVELEGDDEIGEDDEPLDWDAEEAEEADEEEAPAALPDDAGANRRFWFEHATGAGKTVAAVGFAEASRTGGVLILTHRRNLVDQFNGELADRGYKKRLSAPLMKGKDKDENVEGPVTVETYQWFVRNVGKISDAYTIVICDEAHTALGEKTSASIRQCALPVFFSGAPASFGAMAAVKAGFARGESTATGAARGFGNAGIVVVGLIVVAVFGGNLAGIIDKATE